MIEIIHDNIPKLTDIREEFKPGDAVATFLVPITFKRS
jgi:hypothetical protein